MLYGLFPYCTNRLSYLRCSMDFYDKKETKCDTCGRTVTDIQLKYWPPKFVLNGGKRYPDWLHFVSPFDDKCGMILSEKALYAFQSEKVSGFVAEPVTIADNPKNTKNESLTNIPDYYYVYVKGSISLDYQKMHYRKKNVCCDCGQYTWSRQKIGESVLDYSTWDRSDICKLIDYPNCFVCTQKVIDVIKKYGLKGFSMLAEQDLFRILKARKIC